MRRYRPQGELPANDKLLGLLFRDLILGARIDDEGSLQSLRDEVNADPALSPGERTALLDLMDASGETDLLNKFVDFRDNPQRRLDLLQAANVVRVVPTQNRGQQEMPLTLDDANAMQVMVNSNAVHIIDVPGDLFRPEHYLESEAWVDVMGGYIMKKCV